MYRYMNYERHNTREVPTDFPWNLMEDITNGFAVEQKIGSGGYGVVYKGVHPNGQEVAVKKLHHMPGLDEDQFQNELRILTRIRHPNIVQLVGKSYIERDRCIEHQGRLVFATMIDRAICLEFLPEGSLEKHLSDECSGLRWHNRYKIIKGICDGLKYLHGEKIFHLDLKPSNILLDKYMVPKIADFGLSRLFSGTCQSHTTKNLLCTLGYAPPEFVDKGKITNKFDVFSLGVIMIKVLAGPDGYSTYSDMPKSQDFIDLVQENWREIMLLKAVWKDASYLDAYCKQVKLCTQIALKCVESNSHKRPSIEDIINMLNETEETIDKMYQKLFVVEPPHLCFPFEPDKPIPCPVHLTNNADHHISFKIQPNAPGIFAGSLRGNVPARSTQTYILTMQKQRKPRPPIVDTIHILSVVTNCDVLNSFTEAEVVHDERKVVKITSGYECASQLSSKARIEVLSLKPTYIIDVHPLEPWVLIGSGRTKGIEIWDFKTRVKCCIDTEHLDLSNILPLKKDVTVAKFIARNQWFVAGYRDGFMDVYCYKTMQRLKQIEAHQSKLVDLAVHPTEPYVMSASLYERNVKLWDWERGWECTRIFEFIHPDHVFQVTFLNIKGRNAFAVHGDTGIIQICSLRSSHSAEFILSEYVDPDISCFGYFPNGDQQYLITGDRVGTVKIWDLHTQTLVETVEGVHISSVNAICCHPDGEHPVLVTGSDDETVCLWNPTTLRPQRTFNFGLGFVVDVKLSMDSSRSYKVVIAHCEGSVMIETDGNDPVVDKTGSNSKVEKDVVGPKKRKRPKPDRLEIENGENDFVVGVMDTGMAEQMQDNGPMDEETHSVSSKLLDVYPGKLQLPFKANKLTSCSLQLTNTMIDDHVAVRLLTKCPKRYMAKMPLCCIVPPNCMYALIVTSSYQKKGSLPSSDEFLTLESTICLEEDIIGLRNANLDSAATEFRNFFKQAKEMAADKVYELKLSVVSDPLKETSAEQKSRVEIISNRKFSHVLSVDVHPTEPWILTTNQAGEVLIWDYQSQVITKSFDFTQGPVYSAKFIEREEWIVAGDGYGTIFVYSYRTDEEVTSIEAHDSDITSLDVHPTDPLVLSSSEDCLIKLWDWEKNWECTQTFEGHLDRVTHAKFNPVNTSSFATASLDHTIKIWYIYSRESKITLSDHSGGQLCVHSYTSDMRQYLIAGSWNGTGQIWDMETGNLVQTLKGHACHISCVYHHPELPVVITGSHDGTIRLWSSTTYRLESIVGINLGAVHALGYIKDLTRIVVGCQQGIAIMRLNYI